MVANLSLPPISILITTYNRPQSLARLLQSLADQKHIIWKEHEVVVVDDGSDPRPELPETPFLIHYLYRERDDGSPHLYSNLNWAVRESSKEMLWSLQDDSYVDDHSLLILQLLHRACPDTMLWPHLADTAEPHWYQHPGSTQSLVDVNQCKVPWVGMSLPRHIWEEVGGADEDFDGSMGWADCEFSIRVFKAGYDITMVRGICVFMDDSETGGSWRDRVLTPWRAAHLGEDDPNAVKLWEKWPFTREW